LCLGEPQTEFGIDSGDDATEALAVNTTHAQAIQQQTNQTAATPNEIKAGTVVRIAEKQNANCWDDED
jgi:hypothetical protein